MKEKYRVVITNSVKDYFLSVEGEGVSFCFENTNPDSSDFVRNRAIDVVEFALDHGKDIIIFNESQE